MRLTNMLYYHMDVTHQLVDHDLLVTKGSHKLDIHSLCLIQYHRHQERQNIQRMNQDVLLLVIAAGTSLGRV